MMPRVHCRVDTGTRCACPTGAAARCASKPDLRSTQVRGPAEGAMAFARNAVIGRATLMECESRHLQEWLRWSMQKCHCFALEVLALAIQIYQLQ